MYPTPSTRDPMISRRIAYNTMAQLAGKFAGFAVSSFFLIVLAAELGTAGMGLFTTITAFVATFASLADLGVSFVMMRELAQHPERRVEITGEFYGFRLTLSLGIMALAPLIASLVPAFRGLVAQGIAIAALAQFLLLVNQTFVGVLQVNLRLDQAMLAEFVNRTTVLALALVGARHCRAPEEFLVFILWATVASASLNALGSFLFARRLWPIRPSWDRRAWRRMVRLVIPMAGFTFLYMAHFRSATILLSLLRPAYDVGIFGYASKIAEIALSLPLLFLGVVFPRASALYRIDRPAFLSFSQQAFYVLAVFTLPFIAAVYVLAPYLTALLARQSPADGLLAGRALQVLCLGMVGSCVGPFFQQLLLAGASYAGLTGSVGLTLVLDVVLGLWLIPRYSFRGAASAAAASELALLLLTVIVVRRVLGFRVALAPLLPVAVGTAAMAFVLVAGTRLLAPTLGDFAVAPRTVQLVHLARLGFIAAGSYAVAILAWGNRSPARRVVAALRKD